MGVYTKNQMTVFAVNKLNDSNASGCVCLKVDRQCKYTFVYNFSSMFYAVCVRVRLSLVREDRRLLTVIRN